MSQPSSDKFVYFTVGILKDSKALEALKEDALKHHMIDQPGQLIALRLTEYYEMMNEGVVQPVVRVPAILKQVSAPEETEPAPAPRPAPQFAPPPIAPSPVPLHAVPPQPASPNHSAMMSQMTGKMRALKREETFIPTSPTADQNADEAADYWSTL